MPLTPLDISGNTPKSLVEEELDIEIENDDPNADLDDDVDLFDEDEDEELEDEVIEDEDLEEEDDSDDEDEEETDEIEEEEDEEESRGPRENDRIRTLVEERNQTTSQLEAERKKRIELEKQMIEFQKQTVESTKSQLSQVITSIKAQMITAHENGDNEKYIDLQEQLNKTQMDVAQLEAWQPPEIQEEPEVKQKPKTIADAPIALQNWAAKNPWFENPKTPEDHERREAALKYSEFLTKSGYTIEQKAFFTMVNEKLEKLGLANTPSDNVQSKKDTKSSDGRKKKKKKISQTVQGASRTPSSKKASKTRKVKLSQEQRDLAKLYGMTDLEYAQEMLRIEDAKNSGNRMTTLKL